MASLEEALSIALDHMQAGRSMEAAALLDRILDAVPEQPDALHLQGVLLGQAGRIADAADRFARAIAQRPGSPDLHLNLGRAERALGWTERAADSLRAALALDPDLAAARGELTDLLWRLGREAEKTGRPGDAEAHHREALSLDPGRAEVWFHLGGLLQDAGRVDEALAAYGTALERASDLENAWINRALLHGARGDAALAAADWRAALACGPAYPRALGERAAVAERGGDWHAAVLWLRRAVAARLPVVDADERLRFAGALRSTGRTAEALAFVTDLAVREPGNAHAWRDAGATLGRLERLGEGRRALDRALNLAPLDGTVRAVRAALMRSVGDTRAADGHSAGEEGEKYRKMWSVDAYRTFSPGEAQAGRFDLPSLLRRFGARSVLDAGCGSGKTSRYILTHAPGEFDLHGFDIADNCLDPFFDPIKDRYLTVGCLWRREDVVGDYDAVICTDVMEHIPTDKVPDVLANLRAVCRRVAFFGIALVDDVFGPLELGEPLHLTVKPPDWWLERLREAGFEPLDVATDSDRDGTLVWLYALLKPV
ncbi:tetratricopeptide repeat protein [Azospirillum baldaniorum]|uniref:class I SAM-dependent methyltransferase n=1 Tax=Azospirillum baldaniorum TaxID=1064539 RepID=UPI0011AD4BB1|nr:class I SAM-dependent methyltransferase [Azospirillum baldaniorum]TWA68397.1 tetratricopeptide repeat protein [Azospirillum baldaniorum]